MHSVPLCLGEHEEFPVRWPFHEPEMHLSHCIQGGPGSVGMGEVLEPGSLSGYNSIT